MMKNVQEATATTLGEADLAFYRQLSREASFEVSFGTSNTLWQDMLFLEHSGNRVQAKRVRAFAPFDALAALSRPATSPLDVARKVGLAQQVQATPGSIVAAMIAAAVEFERERWSFEKPFVVFNHPRVNPLRPGVAERIPQYDAKRLLRSTAILEAEARRHLGRLPLLVDGDPDVELGCRGWAIDAAIMALAVPSRGRDDLASKFQLMFDVFPLLGAEREVAMVMMVAATRVEAAKWGDGSPAKFASSTRAC